MASSLRRNLPGEMRLYVLCLDDTAFSCLQKLKLPDIFPVNLPEFEKQNPDLLAVKETRSKIEYFFTSTPCWVMYVLEQFPEAQMVTYVDADLFFYSSVQPVFDEMKGASILVIPHRFPEKISHLVKYGIYNVAFQVFRRNIEAIDCLAAWRRACIKSCADNIEDGQFGDQRYLDEWPTRYNGVHVLQHIGADVAPWNVEQYSFTRRDGQVYVDGVPLVFYHFQGYREFSRSLIDPGLVCNGWECPPSVVRQIHLPYVSAMQVARRKIARSGYGLYSGKGETRGYAAGADIGSASVMYKIRFFLEGRAVFSIGGHAFYCGVRLLRPICSYFSGGWKNIWLKR